MSEGMKKIEAALADVKVLDADTAMGVSIAMTLLMLIVDENEGRDLNSVVETRKHRYTLKLTREDL